MRENVENIENDEKTNENIEITPEQKELIELKEKYLRVLAEYDNFRKRTQREREALYTDIKAGTLSQMLPVLDNVERALKTETSDTAYKAGIEMISKQFIEVLSKCGVAEIDAQDKPFDPFFHDAVMHVEDAAITESTVVEVFQKGYKIGEDKVLRPSVVKVAN